MAHVDGQQPDRPAADDGDRLARGRRALVERGERRGERLDERAEPRVQTGRQGDQGLRVDRDAIGEDPLPVEAEQPATRAQVLRAGQAGGALATGDEREDRELLGLARKPAHGLVPEHQRGLPGAVVPAVRMHVGAADAGDVDLDHDLALRGLGRGQLLHAQAVGPVPDERPRAVAAPCAA